MTKNNEEMTNKQIIDMSNCIYHNNGKCTNSAIGQCNCANVASCYYKEYKRKEQECEMWKNLTVDNGAVALKYQQQLDKLKEENDALFKAIEEVNKINKRLETENEELKKQLETYKDDEQLEKEMQQLYNKFGGSSLIEKRSPYEN